MNGVPRLNVNEAALIAANLYHAAGNVIELPSERDQNFLVQAYGEPSLVLKVANTCEQRSVLEGENFVMHTIASTGLCPEVFPNRNADDIGWHGQHMVRLISALPGKTLGDTAYHSDELRRDVGRSVGRFDAALANEFVAMTK